MKSRNVFSSLMGASLVATSLGSVPALAEDVTITMAAPDWPPTRFMKEHFDATYTSPDGHTTSLDMDFIPWPSFYERVAASLTSGEQKYQMIVTDSQWLGAFVEGGYYMDLTDKINAFDKDALAAHLAAGDIVVSMLPGDCPLSARALMPA